MSRLKRWESPRREGRNDKGKGGSARQRQIKKQMKALRRKLKEDGNSSDSSGPPNPLQQLKKQQPKNKREEPEALPFLFAFICSIATNECLEPDYFWKAAIRAAFQK